ncbi:hypothetical protein AB7281_21935 [Providencia rettgeri]|uniref:hypothetical protein n=1 Tax=Providencia alcalifaciens TaxID=126385 RepID=UPI00029BE814|nr:hypothetical protein OO9_19455 [Providencia alcalifaciens Dmel2]
MKEKMIGFLSKTFGGLNKSYYFRHLAFGIALSALLLVMRSQSNQGIELGLISLAVINALLYPYARFVYESIIDFITGGNVFIFSGIMLLVMFMVKLFTMIMCWGFSIFIAPVGLLYLFYYHTKNSQESA